MKGGFVDRSQRRLAQGATAVDFVGQSLVQADEPLRGVAKDDRRLGPPGVRIAMLQPAAGEQRARFDQLVDDRIVGRAELADPFAFGFQHLQPAEQRHLQKIGAVFVDGLWNLPVAGSDPKSVVVGAMAGSGMDESRPDVVRDMIAGQQRDLEAVTRIESGERMGGDNAGEVASRSELAPAGHLGGSEDGFSQRLGEDETLARPRPGLERQVRLQRLDLIDGVVDLRVIGDRPVGGDGPRGGGPDDHAGALERRRGADDREPHPDGGRDVVVVLDLGVGQGRALHRTPHHRLRAAVDLAGGDELHELGDDCSLGREVHGGVAPVPVT